MTNQGNLSNETKSPGRRLRFIPWRGLLKLLGLVVVFAVGFAYAKMVTRFPAGHQSASKYQAPIQANPAIVQSHVAPQVAQFSNKPIAAAPSSATSATSQPKFRSTAPPTTNSPKKSNGFHAQANTPPSTAIQTFGAQVGVAQLGSPPHLSPKLATRSGMLSDTQSSANVSWQNPPSNSPVQPTYIPAGQIVGSGFLQAATGSLPGAEVSSEEKVGEENILKLVGEIHQAKKSEKTELIEKLKTQILSQFKLRHAAQAKEIEELEKELEKAKTLHAKRNDKQDEIVERRYRQLMNEPDDLDWNRGLKDSAQQSSPLPVGPSVYYAQ